MNRTLESRIRRLEKEADMSSLHHLTDDELDERIIEALRQLTAGHSSIMGAIEHWQGTGDPDYVKLADSLDRRMPMIREIVARQYPTAA
ncbi:hypothetical protein FF100_28335 [Methylobacterium terricola]|uniref:Uncharacterized protein n=1 Tax=Methylobacterium terricola TaxID=2583531 RepID=A0A5C4LAN8_9HYPH|nr:hypothetical protein [Methylobacterium terricola]TNC08752.1 hypothetical protein FF100_28335 [Methylobacterium terricola]